MPSRGERESYALTAAQLLAGECAPQRGALAVWFLTAYGVSIVLAPYLNQFRLGGAPLGFWFAQQGSLYVFIVLIWIYARRMDALDRQDDVHED